MPLRKEHSGSIRKKRGQHLTNDGPRAARPGHYGC